jgi:carbonic anhydrase/acetyltransferase-like protein (isoleucine patch superfamily)
MKLTIDKNWKVGDKVEVRGLICTITSKMQVGVNTWDYELSYKNPITGK